VFGLRNSNSGSRSSHVWPTVSTRNSPKSLTISGNRCESLWNIRTNRTNMFGRTTANGGTPGVTDEQMAFPSRQGIEAVLRVLEMRDPGIEAVQRGLNHIRTFLVAVSIEHLCHRMPSGRFLFLASISSGRHVGISQMYSAIWSATLSPRYAYHRSLLCPAIIRPS
jgi:hypothetical protein